VGWERDAAGRPTGHPISLIPVVLKPSSHGVVRLRTADPATVPIIDQRLFSDPEGHDAAVLADGVELARAVAGSEPLRSLLHGSPAPDALPGEAFTLYHPAGTCRMGRAGADDAVVDPDGRVQGVDGLVVADASILPTIPRANTHLTVLAVAEAMAERLAR
jgi:choline dehydrogenase